ncbi:MAG TPA: homoserine dehydrogenase [Firmicutes bacterium]|nr:homoserine dehydrogenase [Bacillota bacterium]
MSEILNIGLLGLGTVGGGVFKLLQQNNGVIAQKLGRSLNISRILERDMDRVRQLGVDPQLVTTEPGLIFNDPEIDIIIEVIGGIGVAREFILQALSCGKSVVTANKDLLALHGRELFEAARAHGTDLFFEASVGGGIPIIRPLKECLAGNRIHQVMGIVNGTTNYILTRMAQEGMGFQEALAQAQCNGFAEADPANDIEGKDAAYKLAILGGMAFRSRIDPRSIHVEGIKSVTPEDIFYARELGYVIKLLAVGEDLNGGLALRVYPSLVPVTHPLAAVMYEFNAIFMVGDSVGEVMFYGRGAGALPTASAVLADAVEAAGCIKSKREDRVAEIGYQAKPVIPAEALTSRFYLRLQAIDRPGVFADLATSFGKEQVSLDMIIQKRSEGGIAEIVLVTHNVLEERFNRALSRIRELGTTKQVNSVFRVL